MHNLVTAPLRVSEHLAIWIVWQSIGVTLVAPRKPELVEPARSGARPSLRRRPTSAASVNGGAHLAGPGDAVPASEGDRKDRLRR